MIFDLDGVITDTAKYHYLAWRKIAEELGLGFDETFNERLKGIDRMTSLEIILKNSEQVFSDEAKLEIAETKNGYYQQLIAKMSPDDLLSGTLRTFESLKNKQVKIGLASASKNAPEVIARLGITGYFDYIADASKIKKGKPNPEIFLTTALNLECAPQNCIGVEDAIAGISAIKQAGMIAVGVGDPSVLTEADYVIRDLSEFEIEQYY